MSRKRPATSNTRSMRGAGRSNSAGPTRRRSPQRSVHWLTSTSIPGDTATLLWKLIEIEAGHPDRSREAAFALIRMGELLNLTGRPAAALELLDQASEMLSSFVQPPDYDLSKCTEYRGQALLQLGRTAEAREACERAAQEYRAVLGEDSTDEALALNRLGQCEYLLGNDGRAKHLFKTVLAQLRRQRVLDHREIATTLANLVMVSAPHVPEGSHHGTSTGGER